jgi:uncharacterized protein (DUF305 family)
MRLNRTATFIPLLALMLAGGTAQAQHEGHMGHMEGMDHGMDHAGHMDMATPARSDDRDVLYNPEDMQFLHHMSMHHQQALAMAALVPERAEHQEFKKFARYVARGQAAEIRSMDGLQKLAEDRGIAAAHAHMDHDPPMAGMLSKAEMTALAAAKGDEFERRWLEGMIFHHEGGLAMARAQQLQQLEFQRSPYGLAVMVEDILVEQRAEVSKMYDWLADWGLVPAGDKTDARTPASEVVSPVPMAVLPAGRTVELIGLAVDDRGIETARIAIQNLDDKSWWRDGDTWSSERTLHAATLEQAGFSSVAWTYEWMPPKPGHYAITVLAEDTAGKVAEGYSTREFRVQ